MKLIIVLIFFLCLSICNFNGAADNKMHKYGEKVLYSNGKELKFPDFLIRFAGKREENISKDRVSPLKMTFYDFEVTKDEAKEKVSWSSGTGDIAPAFFEIGGADYVLELGQSDIIKGSLGEGNLVIWKKADYEQELKKKSRSYLKNRLKS